MDCPSCGHSDVLIYGKTAKGKLRYICSACHNTFVEGFHNNHIFAPVNSLIFRIRFGADRKYSIMMVSILAITTYFFAKLLALHFAMILNPFPNEYREGAILLSTKLIVEGGNPYTLENQPEFTNLYGIIYHLVVYPFAKVFGSTLIVHRTISAFFIFASCIVLFVAAHRMKVSLALCFTGATIFYAHLLFFAAPLARPDSLGMFLFLCSIFIPWRFNYSVLSLLSSISIGILAFLTKPYFILAIFYIGTYIFLFRSKMRSIKYFGAVLISLVSTILLINGLFECYWNNTFFVFANASNLDYPDYPGIQLYKYAEYNLGMVAILFLVIFRFSEKLQRKLQQLTRLKDKISSTLISFTSLNKPLFNINLASGLEWSFYMLLSLGLFYFKFGRHNGSWLVYINHLVSPFLIIIALRFVSEKRLGKLILLTLLCLNLFSVTKADVLPSPNLDNIAWEEIKVLISQHQNILNSPAIVPLLIEQGKRVYDSGLTEYFHHGIKRNIFGINFPGGESVKNRNEQFIQEVTKTIESKGFDLVTMTNHYSPFISEDLLQKHYQYKKSITVPMSPTSQSWKLDIWEPKS
jgi:hypothetical protein